MNARDTFLSLAPNWLQTLLLAARWVKSKDGKWATSQSPHETELLEDSIFSEGWTIRAHSAALLLDIDYPAALIPSSTPGHSHLILMPPYARNTTEHLHLLDVLAGYRIIEKNYAVSQKKQGQVLRLPWIRKGHEREDAVKGGHMSPELYEWLLSSR